MLRYDTQFDPQGDGFHNGLAWRKFDAKAQIGGKGGYTGAVFDDERYVYFVPEYDGGPHATVLRYDTKYDLQGDEFESPAAWIAFDAKAGVGAEGGYQDGVFDDRYVYFVPGPVVGQGVRGEVLRYDTQAEFQDPLAWDKCDVAADPTIGARGGYAGAVYDKQRYIYFVPFHTGSGGDYHGEVLRYDTQGGGFCGQSAWEKFEYGEHCSKPAECNDPRGYRRGVFDCLHGFAYFAPNCNGSYHGEVMRYDTGLPPPPSPEVKAWQSLRTHGNGVGELAIALSPVSECRRGGIQKIVVEFSEAVVSADGNLDPGDVSVTNSVGTPYMPASVALTSGSKKLEINFAAGALPDQERYTFELDAKFKSAATGLPLSGTTSCQVRALIADVSSDGVVNIVDANQLKGKNGQAVDGTTARFDLNTDGWINLMDLALVKAKLFNTAP